MKYADQPDKFLESEVDLDEAVKNCMVGGWVGGVAASLERGAGRAGVGEGQTETWRVRVAAGNQGRALCAHAGLLHQGPGTSCGGEERCNIMGQAGRSFCM